MNRIFHPDLNEGQSFNLSSEDHRHLFRSLRLQEGDKIEVGDGKGNVATAKIELIDKKTCRVKISSIEHYERKYPELVLGFSILKSDSRMEWLIEKAVELNASALVPLVCHRCEKSRIKKTRLERISISAFKQSLNPYLTALNDPISFKDYIGSNSTEESYIAVCEGERTPISSIKKNKSTLLLIGPEGDFTEDEVNFAKEHGAKPIILGDMRLRSETAAIAALSYFTLNEAR